MGKNMSLLLYLSFIFVVGYYILPAQVRRSTIFIYQILSIKFHARSIFFKAIRSCGFLLSGKCTSPSCEKLRKVFIVITGISIY